MYLVSWWSRGWFLGCSATLFHSNRFEVVEWLKYCLIAVRCEDRFCWTAPKNGPMPLGYMKEHGIPWPVLNCVRKIHNLIFEWAPTTRSEDRIYLHRLSDAEVFCSVCDSFHVTGIYNTSVTDSRPFDNLMHFWPASYYRLVSVTNLMHNSFIL